jgi:transposase
LDALNKQEDTLQIHLYSQLERIDASIGEGFFYDITSTYLEGSQCVIAKLGYSRDHRPDREQIVIALIVTPQGSLFYWKVLAGNTQDITTIPGLAIHLTRLERVKAHVSVYVLAYLLRNTMEMMLRQAGYMDSPEEILKQIQSCQLNLVGFEGHSTNSIMMTKMTEQQKRLTDILQCNKYLQPKAMQLLTKSLETSL